MVNFDKIPRLEITELAKSIMTPIKEFYDDPKNKEKFKTWQKKQNNIIK